MAEMKFFKIIAGILICGIFALFYVHQEVQTVKLGVLINKQGREVSFLLDQYRSLIYNLSRLESPGAVEETLCTNEIMLCMPRLEDKRNLSRIGLAYVEEKTEEKRSSFLARVFDRFSVKAEAKVVSPVRNQNF